MSSNQDSPPEAVSNQKTVEFVGTRRSAFLALLLLVPAPTVGVGIWLLIFPEGAIGKAIQGVFKIWIFILPVCWWMLVDKQKPSFPKPTLKGMGVAVGTGVFIFIVMLGAFQLFKSHIPLDAMREKAKATGFDNRAMYIGIFIFLITINSLLEEYVWRWFVFRKSEVLCVGWFGKPWGGRIAAILAGLFFTVHHVIALAAWVPPMINALASIGVFVGSATWSALYLRYRSIWPGYVSHVFADIAIFIIGWELIFGF